MALGLTGKHTIEPTNKQTMQIVDNHYKGRQNCILINCDQFYN